MERVVMGLIVLVIIVLVMSIYGKYNSKIKKEKKWPCAEELEKIIKDGDEQVIKQVEKRFEELEKKYYDPISSVDILKRIVKVEEEVFNLTLEEQYVFFKEQYEKLKQLDLEVWHTGKHNCTIETLVSNYNDENVEFFKKKEFKQYTDIVTEFLITRGYTNNTYEFIKNFNNNCELFRVEARGVKAEVERAFLTIKAGIEGENKVNEDLDLYRDIFVNLKNIRIEVENTSVESDNILVTEKGIFVLEVKNLGSNSDDILYISKDGKWSRGKGERRTNIESATSQLNRHIGIQQRFLNQKLKEKYGAGFEYIYFNPIIVIANDSINIENESIIPVMRVSNVYHYIRCYVKDNKLDKKYWKDIIEILEGNSKGSKPYPVTSRSRSIIENIEVITQQHNKILALNSIYSDTYLTLERMKNFHGRYFDIPY